MKVLNRLAVVLPSLGLMACGTGGGGSMAGVDHSPAASAAAGLDQKFVTGMLPHHQAAIDMAKVQLQKGKNAQAKALAQAIIDDQTREQGLMKTVAVSHSWNIPSMSMGADQLMGEPIQIDMSQMAADVAAATDTDRAFLKLMIPHHSMAVLMADTEARNGTDPQLKQLANSIVAAQAKEIGEMQSILGALG